MLKAKYMNCPFCKNCDTRVLDKRTSGTASIRRRRECEKCKKRFTTYERVETVLLNVLKRDGTVQEFDREKLKRGVMKALSKRDIPEEQVDDIISEIEHKLMVSDKQIVRTVDIGEMVLRALTKIDKLAALLFASVYKEFQSLDDVQRELERLSKKN
jgi:transcriptional repressor NrdR